MSIFWKHGKYLKSAEITKHDRIVHHQMQKCYLHRLDMNNAPLLNS